MAEEEEYYEEPELSDAQKVEIAKWFLANAPVGEIKYIARDLRLILRNERLYNEAAEEAFPLYNKLHLVCLDMPRSYDKMMVTTFGELDDNTYLDPRNAQVATVDHIEQVCTKVRPANDEELPTAYIEEFRYSLDSEVLKYVTEAYPKGWCSVYCVNGKDVEEPGDDFELVVVISGARHSPQNFCNGSWRSVWNIEFKDDIQILGIKGKIQVVAHYFEEGNVQLDTKHECRDSTILQAPEDCAITIANIIRHHESEYMASLQGSYAKLSDNTFKVLRPGLKSLPSDKIRAPFYKGGLELNLKCKENLIHNVPVFTRIGSSRIFGGNFRLLVPYSRGSV